MKSSKKAENLVVHLLVAGALCALATPVRAGLLDELNKIGIGVDDIKKGVDHYIHSEQGSEPKKAPAPAPQQAPLPAPQRPVSQPQTPDTYNHDQRKVAKVQRALNALGYDAGSVDGAYGGTTRRAILAFEADHHLPAGGNVTDKLIAALDSQMASSATNSPEGGQPTATEASAGPTGLPAHEDVLAWGPLLGMTASQLVDVLKKQGFHFASAGRWVRKNGVLDDTFTYRVPRGASLTGNGRVSEFKASQTVSDSGQTVIDRLSEEAGAKPKCAGIPDVKMSCRWTKPPSRPAAKEIRLVYSRQKSRGDGRLIVTGTAVDDLEQAAPRQETRETVKQPARSPGNPRIEAADSHPLSPAGGEARGGGMVAPALGPAPVSHQPAAGQATDARPEPSQSAPTEVSDSPTQSRPGVPKHVLAWGPLLGMTTAQIFNVLEMHGFRASSRDRWLRGQSESFSFTENGSTTIWGRGLIDSFKTVQRIDDGREVIDRASKELGAKPQCSGPENGISCVWKKPPSRPAVKEIGLAYRAGELTVIATAVDDLEQVVIRQQEHKPTKKPVQSLEGITVIRLADSEAAKEIRGDSGGSGPYLVTFLSDEGSYAALIHSASRECMAWATGGDAARSIKLGISATSVTKAGKTGVCAPFTLTLLSHNLVRIDATNPIASSPGGVGTGPGKPYSGTHAIIAHIPIRPVNWDMDVFSKNAVKGVALGPFSAVRRKVGSKAKVSLEQQDKNNPNSARAVGIEFPNGKSTTALNGEIISANVLGRPMNALVSVSSFSGYLPMRQWVLSEVFDREVIQRYGEPSRTAGGAAGKERLQWFFSLDGRRLDLKDMGPPNCLATRQWWIDYGDLHLTQKKEKQDIGPWGCSLILQLTQTVSRGKVRDYTVEAASGYAIALAHFDERLQEVEAAKAKISKIRAYKPKL